MSDLLVIESKTPAEIYTGDALENILGKIEAEVRAFVPDMSTKQGREAIASIAYKVARSKTALDKMGTELTEQWRKQTDTVNAQRKVVKARLEALQVEVRKPLTDWENAEETRVNELKSRLQELSNCGNFLTTPNKETLEKEILKANALYQYNWQELQPQADLKYNALKSSLDNKLAERIKYEAEQVELDRLRKEAAERAQKDHEEKIAREAAEKARLEAEAKAKSEAEAEAKKVEEAKKEASLKAEQERQKLEDEKKAADEARIKAEQEKEAAAKKAEEEKRLAAEEAETKRKAEEEARKVAEDRAKKAEADLKAANEKASQEALDRVKKAYDSYSGVIIEWATYHKLQVSDSMVLDLINRMMVSANQKQRKAA